MAAWSRGTRYARSPQQYHRGRDRLGRLGDGMSDHGSSTSDGGGRSWQNRIKTTQRQFYFYVMPSKCASRRSESTRITPTSATTAQRNREAQFPPTRAAEPTSSRAVGVDDIAATSLAVNAPELVDTIPAKSCTATVRQSSPDKDTSAVAGPRRRRQVGRYWR